MKVAELWCDECQARTLVSDVDGLSAGDLVECQWCYEPLVVTQGDIDAAQPQTLHELKVSPPSQTLGLHSS